MGNATHGVSTRIPCCLLLGVKNKTVIMEEVTWFKVGMRISKYGNKKSKCHKIFFRCNLTLGLGRCYPNDNDNKYFAFGILNGEPSLLIVLRTSAEDIGTYRSVDSQNCCKNNNCI